MDAGPTAAGVHSSHRPNLPRISVRAATYTKVRAYRGPPGDGFVQIPEIA